MGDAYVVEARPDGKLSGTLFGRWRRASIFGSLIWVSLLAAVVIDYLAPWPYVMTPLYAVPILIGAHCLSVRQLGPTAALIVAFNIISSLVQKTPLSVTLFYTAGLVLTAYLALRLAQQRRETLRHGVEAEEARRQLRVFLSMVAHDLRSPLAGLLGCAQLLRRRGEGAGPEVRERALLTIEHAAQRLARLTDDLADASRIGVGRFPIRPTAVDLVALARDVVALRQTTTDAHHLVLDAPERLEGCWDRDRLSQLLGNLVSNAIVHSSEGDVRVTIRRELPNVVVSVSDQGPGISAEQLRLLFQPFSRLDESRTTKGMGLGLYISKGIAEAHGGRIWVESQPAQGATFYVALPLRETPHEAAIAPVAGPVKQAVE